MPYVHNMHPQVDALALMGLDVGESKGSMWMQAFKICNNNWVAFTEDQERNKPLVATRFYTNRWAKGLPPSLMSLLIQEVGNILSFSRNLFWLSIDYYLCLEFMCVFVCRSPTRALNR